MNRTPYSRAILLCMVVFFLQPLGLGVWLARVADVKLLLGLDNFQLAIALMGLPAGLLPSLQLAGKLVGRIGPRKAMFWLFPAQLLALTFPGMASGTTSLFLALFAVGATVAVLEVGLNVYAGRVERHSGRAIMNRAHGFWSAGVVAGSFLGSLLAGAGLGPLGSLILVAALSLPVALLITRQLPAVGGDEAKVRAPRLTLRSIPRPLAMISLCVLGVSMVEGAMSDWGAVYMRDVMGVAAGAGYAVTAFAAAVTLGRFAGDGLKMRLGAVNLTRGCAVFALVGVGLLVLSVNLWTVVLGFVLTGLGVSAVYPLGISAVTSLDEEMEAPFVAVMTFVGLLGFLVGPPLIGFIAEASNLRLGLSVLLPGLVLSFVLAPRMAPKPGF